MRFNSLKSLFTLAPHKRPLGFLIMAALAIGLPALLGVWLDQFQPAIIACIGGLVVLYVRQTSLPHRMLTLGAGCFGFALCFVIGILTSFNGLLSAFTLTLTVFLVTALCRYFMIPPPGSFMFIMVACISRTLPFDLGLAAERTGILLFGCMGASVIALIYSIGQIYWFKPVPIQVPPAADPRIDAIILEAGVIAAFIGGSYLLAMLMQLENPYWVPVSCAAVMQGASFRDVRQRNVHRIVGTFVGMGLAWLIFSFSPGPWALALLITLLSFMIEIVITRNYALAVMFMTPLTVILAESNSITSSASELIRSRMLDILLGSSIGYLGGWTVHHPKFFSALELLMRKRRAEREY